MFHEGDKLLSVRLTANMLLRLMGVLMVSFTVPVSHGQLIADCSFASNQLVAVKSGGPVTLECKMNRWFSTCTLNKMNSSKVCTGILQNQLNDPRQLKVVAQPSCALNQISLASISSEGNYSCSFTITKTSVADEGIWTVEFAAGRQTISQRLELRLEPDDPIPAECKDMNYDYRNHDIRNMAAASASDCSRECVQDDKCFFWSWTSTSCTRCSKKAQCYLKSHLALESRYAASGIISGSKMCPECYQFGVGLTSSGLLKDQVLNTHNALECQRLCQNNSLCMYANWNQKSGKCYPRSGELNSQTDKRWVADSIFLSSKFCQTRPTVTSTSSEVVSISNEEASRIADPEQNGDGSSTNTIVASVLGPILLIAMISVMLLMITIRRRRRARSKSESEPEKASEAVKREEPTTRPIALQDFVLNVKNKLINYAEEYHNLNSLDFRLVCCQYDDSIGHKYNQLQYGELNRYGNIVPYNQNRVVLKNVVRSCDYVNASWVRTDQGNLIASQGPLTNTVPHFLLMVLENQVPVIVMLTKTTEKDHQGNIVEKCAQYWPKKTNTVANFEFMEVKLISMDTVHTAVTKRTLQLTDKRSNSVWGPVVQFHLHNWPDFGVAKSPGLVLYLADVVRQEVASRARLPGPILVQCSAGVGRTGTFMAIYLILQQLQQKSPDHIDVFRQVFQLRTCRCMMVQKLKQYEFIYECLAEYLESQQRINDVDYVYS